MTTGDPKIEAATASVATLCASAARQIGSGAASLDQAIARFVDPPEPDKPGIVATLNDVRSNAKAALARADALLSKIQAR